MSFATMCCADKVSSCFFLFLMADQGPWSVLSPALYDGYEIGYKSPSSSLQAILFYIPRWLWKNWEAGKVSALRMDLNLGIISDVEKKLKKKLLIDYLYSNLKHHNFWAYRYFFCEFLALLNVSGISPNIRRTFSNLPNQNTDLEVWMKGRTQTL